MNTCRIKTESRSAPSPQRLDPRRESRFSLALVLLMGLATISVMATTQVQSAQTSAPLSLSEIR